MDAITISDSTPRNDTKEALDTYYSSESSKDDVITISTDNSPVSQKPNVNGKPAKNSTKNRSTIEDKTPESSLRLWTESCEKFEQCDGDFNDQTPNSELKVNEWMNTLNFNEGESNSNSSKLNYFSLDVEQAKNGGRESDSDHSGSTSEKIDKANDPLSPETQKKNELCLYLQLMDMNATDKKTVNSMQNRRSTRVKNLKIMSEKRSLDQKLLTEFKESLARKSFDELDMTIQDSFDITSERPNFFNVEFLPPKITENVNFFDDSIMSVIGKEIRKKLLIERKNGVKNNDKENKKLLVAKLKKKLFNEKEKKPEKKLQKPTQSELKLIKAKLRKQNMLRTTKSLRSTKALRSSLNLNNVGMQSLTKNERLISKSLCSTKGLRSSLNLNSVGIKSLTVNERLIRKTAKQNLKKKSKKKFSPKLKKIEEKSVKLAQRKINSPRNDVKNAKKPPEEDSRQMKKFEVKKKSKAVRLLEVKRQNEKRRMLEEGKSSSEESKIPAKDELPVLEVEPVKVDDPYENYVPKKKRMSLLMSMSKKPKSPEKMPLEDTTKKIENSPKKEEFNGSLRICKSENENPTKLSETIEKSTQDFVPVSPKQISETSAENSPKINSITASLKSAPTIPEFSIKYKTQSDALCKEDLQFSGTRAVDLLNMIKSSSASNEATIKEKIHFTSPADIFYKTTNDGRTKNSSPSGENSLKNEKIVVKRSPQKPESTFHVIDLSKNTQYSPWQEHNYTKTSDKDKDYIMNVILGNVSDESSSSSEEEEEDEEDDELKLPEPPKIEDYKEIPKPNVELPKDIFEEPKTPPTPKIEKNLTPKHKRTLHRLLIQKNRGSFDSLDFGNDAWSSEQSLANAIKICPTNGKIIKAIYLGFNLVVVQEQLVSFWTQSPLGNMLGVQRFWVAKGSVQRLLLDNTYICKESQDVVVNLDKSCAYIELWMKEHKSDKRERPVADIFATVYFWSAVNSMQSSKKALQLENIKGDIKDVQYVVLRTARKIVVSWMETQDTETKTIIHCYTLAPDYQTVMNVLVMSPLDHYVQSLHTIGDCADAVVGFGEKYITVWGLEYGEIFETIEIDPRYQEPRIMWLEKDRGLLFFIQYHRIERLLMLVAVNGYSKESKKMQVFRVPSGYEKISGVCVDNNMLAAIFENGVLCWDIKTGYAVIEELCSEDQLIASYRHIVALKSNIVEVVHFQSYFLTNFDLQS